MPLPNNESIRRDKKLSFLFQTSVPGSINGFELSDNDAANMKEFWPAGEATAIQVSIFCCISELSLSFLLHQVLDRFLKTKSRSSQLGAVDPLSPGAQDGANHNRIHKYHQSRDQMDRDTTSRLR